MNQCTGIECGEGLVKLHNYFKQNICMLTKIHVQY